MTGLKQSVLGTIASNFVLYQCVKEIENSEQQRKVLERTAKSNQLQIMVGCNPDGKNTATWRHCRGLRKCLADSFCLN